MENKMNLKEKSIQIIESLYPADSDSDEIAKIGLTLLNQAKRIQGNWRHEPESVLIDYAMFCNELHKELLEKQIEKDGK
jgi:hypothetical protein